MERRDVGCSTRGVSTGTATESHYLADSGLYLNPLAHMALDARLQTLAVSRFRATRDFRSRVVVRFCGWSPATAGHGPKPSTLIRMHHVTSPKLQSELQRIIEARHHDPFAVLGRHPQDKESRGAPICLRPGSAYRRRQPAAGADSPTPICSSGRARSSKSRALPVDLARW